MITQHAACQHVWPNVLNELPQDLHEIASVTASLPYSGVIWNVTGIERPQNYLMAQGRLYTYKATVPACKSLICRHFLLTFSISRTIQNLIAPSTSPSCRTMITITLTAPMEAPTVGTTTTTPLEAQTAGTTTTTPLVARPAEATTHTGKKTESPNNFQSQEAALLLSCA